MPFRIPQQALDNARRSAFPYRVQDQPVFVKHRHRKKSPLVRTLKHGAFGLTGLAFLAPTRQRTLLEEAARLEQLRELGIPVPQVLHKEQRYFVMADTGTQLDRVLNAQPEMQDRLLPAAMETIRRLHELDQIHGGAQLKNMTYDGETLYLLDFEEEYNVSHVEQHKIRDLLLFFLSLERARYRYDWNALLAVYGNGGLNGTRTQFVREVRKLRFMGLLNRPGLARKLPTDARSFAAAIDKICNLPAE